MLAAIGHRRPDRVPVTVPMATEVARRLAGHLGTDAAGLARWLDDDLVCVHPAHRRPIDEPSYADPTVAVSPEGHFLDIWGVPFRQVTAGEQTYVELAGRPPLAGVESVADLDEHPWPSADDWDYAVVPARLAAAGDRAVRAHSRGFFEIAHFMRGMDAFLTDMALRPELAGGLMDRIAAYLLERSRRTLTAGGGRFDILEYNDDVASQRGLFISPAMWREQIRPRMKPFCDLAHEFGTALRYHCCGSPREIIGDLIDVGVDILNPVQPLAAGMDPFELKRAFGDRLTFDGGIDIQQLLPHATPEEVRRHVRRMVDVVGAGGGYILGPSHSIQADVPDENIVAMIDAARRQNGK